MGPACSRMLASSPALTGGSPAWRRSSRNSRSSAPRKTRASPNSWPPAAPMNRSPMPETWPGPGWKRTTLPFAIRFTPPLAQKDAARRGLEMGHVVKLVFAFKERFWERLFPDEVGFLIASDEPLQGWWTGYPVYAPVLVGWAGGPAADAFAGLATEQRL